MKVTLNTTPMNTQMNVLNSKYNPQMSQQSFTGVSQAYDKFCHGVGKYFSRPIFNNRFIDRIAHSIRNSENAVKHFLAVGSVITSGMYMKQTLTSDKMDKDRRQTLAMNQLFTLILSTIGAYTLDSKLKSWWSKNHKKFMNLSENGQAAWAGMEKRNEKIRKSNARINEDITRRVLSGEIKSDIEINNREELIKIAKKFIKTDKDGTFAQKLAELNIKVPDAKDTKALIKKLEETVHGNGQSANMKLKEMILIYQKKNLLLFQ